MRLLSSGTKAQAHKQHNARAWVWVYEILLEESVDATRPFRITSHNESVTIAGKTYQPYPVVHDVIAGDAQGNLPQFTLTVSNVSREANYYIEQAKGLSGNRVTIGVFNRAAALTGDLVSFTLQVAGCSVTDTTVSLRLQMPSFFEYAVPPEIFVRGRCRWRYKGVECAYRGALPTCDKTLFGVDGCKIHGDDEENNNRPRLHPRRFGGFPGLQRFAV
jgi:lambda family phage minor tail protein L